MEETKTLYDMYVTVGAGGLALIVLMGLIIYFFLKLKPTLDKIQIDSALGTEVIKNNTKAVEELSRSNDNVASALTLLKTSTDNTNETTRQVIELLIKHDERARAIESEVIRTHEVMKAKTEK